MGTTNAIVKLWVNYIKTGKRTIEDVPEKLKEQVAEMLNS